MKKYAEAFITVEYTLLISGVIILYGFIISIGLFMYNECILQTNVCILALEGMHTAALDAAQKAAYLQQKEKELYGEKYLFTEELTTIYDIEGEKVCIEGRGYMNNPINIWGIGQEKWNIYASQQVTAINPADVLRLCKRLLIIKEDILTEGEAEGE
ncbi:MAG: hypothetical protein IJZ84_01000 [Lachnospiraceae bacterium]|nr:hypothetical protein [Lachnospiraceae bacterium]